VPSDEKINSLSRTAKILASKTKLKILIVLLSKKQCVCEIQDCLDKEQSLISHHLADLTKEGWIKQEKVGRQVRCLLTKNGERKLKFFLKVEAK